MMKKTARTKAPAPAFYKKKILFIGDGISLSHVVRPLTLARQINVDDYEIHFATSNGFEEFVRNSNFILHDLKTFQPKEFYGKLKKGDALFDRNKLKELIYADLQLLEKVKPDLIVADFRPSASISSEIKDIPLISLANGYWSPFTKIKMPVPDHPVLNSMGPYLAKKLVKPIFKAVFNQQIKAFKQERKLLGLPPIKYSQEAYNKGTVTAYMDLPELTPTSKLPDNHIFIGPVLWEPNISMPNLPLDKNKKTVYLTLGSTGETSNPENLIDQLIENNFQVITSLNVKTRKNVFCEKYLPGKQVAMISDLIICHGGSGTVYQALNAGKPILAICSNLDQQLAMAMVEKKDMGKSLLYKNASVENIISTSLELLKNQSCANLLKTKEAIQSSNASEAFNKIIKNLCPPLPQHQKTQLKKIPKSQVSHAIKSIQKISPQFKTKPLRDENDSIKIILATTKEQKNLSYELMYDIYLEKEYINKNKAKQHFTEHDLLKETITFLAFKDDEVIGTITAISDSPFGLPAEQIYADELKDLKRDQKICEISALGIKKGARFNNKILVKLINALTLYTTGVLKRSHFIITVNPNHVPFYLKKLLFDVIGKERSYTKVKGAPAMLLLMDLNLVEDSINNQAELIQKRLFKNFVSVAQGQDIIQSYLDSQLISKISSTKLSNKELEKSFNNDWN